MAASPVFVGTIQNYVANANTSTADVTVGAAGANGTRFEHILIYNDHSSALTINIKDYDGSNARILYQISVASKETKNVLAAINPSADKQFLILKTGHTLKFNVTSSVASDVNVYAGGADY